MLLVVFYQQKFDVIYKVQLFEDATYSKPCNDFIFMFFSLTVGPF